MKIKALIEQVENEGIFVNLDYQDETIELPSKFIGFNELSAFIKLMQIAEGRLNAHG